MHSLWEDAIQTALILDIDGTLCPLSGFSPFGPLVEVGVALRPVQVAPALCIALADIGARPHVIPVWLTSWLPETRLSMRSPFPGRDWEQIDLNHGDIAVREEWPKWAALNAWLARHTQISRIAWADDDLNRDAGPNRRRAEFCAEDLQRRSLDALVIAPTAEYGMTPRHIADLERWI